MSGHTPGPWVVNGFGGHFEPVCRLVPSGVLVSAETNRGDEIATARLIAAAPRMAELLRSFHDNSLADERYAHIPIIDGGPTPTQVEAVLSEAGVLP